MGTYIRKTQRTYYKDMLKSCNNEVWQNLTQHFNEREQVGFF